MKIKPKTMVYIINVDFVLIKGKNNMILKTGTKNRNSYNENHDKIIKYRSDNKDKKMNILKEEKTQISSIN